jgi:putative transporter with 12 TMs
MKTTDAWRLSAIPYSEMAFKSILQNSSNMWWGSFGRGSSEASGRDDLVKRALRIARFDKFIITAFVMVAAGAPFLPQVLGASYGITASATLSLAVSFALVVLYGVQTLSSFVTSGPSPVLSTLPLTRKDVSLVNLLSFVRTSDYLVVGSVACQVFFVLLVTGSILSGLFMLLAGAMNSAMGVGVALWLSSVFYRNILGSKQGKRGGVLRLALLLAWGVVVLAIGVLFAAAGYLIPLVQSVLASPDALTGSVLALVYPFSLGISVGSVSQSFGSSLVERIALAATVGYLLVAVAVSRWSMTSVTGFPEGASIGTGGGRTNDTSIPLHEPVTAYAMKDLRAASANLPSAFLFTLPAFETLVILLIRAYLPTLGASTILVAMTLGGMVSLILPLVLVSSEGPGFDFAKTLPLRMRTIIFSKALITTAVFLPAVAVVLVESLLKPLNSSFSILIPLASIMAVAAASLLEVRLFLGFAPGGRVTFALQEFARMAAGAGVVLLPATIYVAAYIFTFNHALAAGMMIVAASTEVFAITEFVRQS